MNACGGSMGEVGDDVFNSDWLIITVTVAMTTPSAFIVYREFSLHVGGSFHFPPS